MQLRPDRSGIQLSMESARQAAASPGRAHPLNSENGPNARPSLLLRKTGVAAGITCGPATYHTYGCLVRDKWLAAADVPKEGLKSITAIKRRRERITCVGDHLPGQPVGRGSPGVASSYVMTRQSTPPAPSYWVLVLAFIVVGVPFSVGVLGMVAAIQLSLDAREAQGTIVGFQTGSSPRGGAVSKPVVAYQVAGQTSRAASGGSTNLPIHSVGDRVAVLYKVNEPGTAYIHSFFDLWLCPLLFTGVGSGSW